MDTMASELIATASIIFRIATHLPHDMHAQAGSPITHPIVILRLSKSQNGDFHAHFEV
jgi:hypothetical protein